MHGILHMFTDGLLKPNKDLNSQAQETHKASLIKLKARIKKTTVLHK
jgi:hypothetical protein